MSQIRICHQHWIFRLPFMRSYAGMVVGRTILLRDEESRTPDRLLRHELVHQEQMDRHGVAGFYLIYLRDYLTNLWRLRGHAAAYRAIPFEQEAYRREVEE